MSDYTCAVKISKRYEVAIPNHIKDFGDEEREKR